MKGDFSRLALNSASKGYARVLKQQGRVDLDADWNEAGAIQAYLDRILVKDVIGRCGVPKKHAGFGVGIGPGGDLTLSKGRIYVGGLLCETGGTTYATQPYLPNPPAIAPEEGRIDLVYLDVWQRHITAIEDPDLLEEALGGADTTTRLQTVWQVIVRQGVDESECDGAFDPWPPLPPLDQRGQLTTGTTATSDESDPCLIAPGGGYHGLENRLYRVEIHDGGQPYAWPRPAGVVATSVSAISNGTDVTVADWMLDGRAWRAGQSVELYSQQSDAGGTAGTLARITALDQANSTLTLSADVSSMTGHTNLRLRRVATYKWSRDNGSVAYAIDEFVSGQPTKVRVKRLGRDQVLALHPNDSVEILGDETELKGLPGTLAAIVPGGIDEADRILTFDRDVSVHAGEDAPKVRRWDQKSEALAVTTDLLTLEDGVQIQFGGQELITGDYWTLTARTATGKVDELVSAPPQGIAHHYCRLGIVTRSGEAGETRALIGLEAGEPVPDLALSWEVSEDGQEWTFKLVDGVLLPDGDPLTAGYVAEVLAEQGYEVEVIDDLTLRLSGLDEEGLLKLSEIPILEAEGLAAHVTDCRPDFPTLTEICAEDVCYDDSGCDAIQAETVQEALDQLCAMRDLRHHNKHLHGWGIVCGLQVHCGPDDPSPGGDLRHRTGDRLTVTVRPGYAIDCEGNDIVLDDELAVPVLGMIEEWEQEHEGEPLLKDGQGRVCLVIERDEHGEPRVVLRPYDPADDTLKAMLQGTLLMDFVQDCILEPWQEIRKLLSPEAEEGDGKLVSDAQRQFITLLNLLVQFWNPQQGNHVYLSRVEHEILHKLYLALRGVLQSKTFCAMFDDAAPFPDYPFEKARMSTIFDGARNRTRLRVHPSGRTAYSVGVDDKIHVYDLRAEELVAVLEMPGGTGLVAQDVAFSADGKQLYAIATLNDEDSIFAVAEIRGRNHRWQPVSILCGVQLRTLAAVSGFENTLFASGRGDGLFVIKLGDVQPNIEPTVAFNACGHLVVDEERARAYASAVSAGASPTAYDRVVEIDLRSSQIIAQYTLQVGDASTAGDDDIAIVPSGPAGDVGKLYAIADGPQKNTKLLFIWQVGNPQEPVTLAVPDTEIRLGYVPGSQYLMGTLEDWYQVGLVDVQQDTAVAGYQMPVQIAPLAIAVDPKGEWVYVGNALSPTITKIHAQHMVPAKETPGGEPAPGSDAFIAALVAYRKAILAAYMDLVGGLLQYLKDCFCHHLLVNCPECDPQDEVYLASVAIRGSEVYQVCNFSRRKYVKSFPTIGYWLSLVPVAPLVRKAVEYLCCLVLPDRIGQVAATDHLTHRAPVKSQQMRIGLAAFQQGTIQRQMKDMVGQFNLAQRVTGDWAGHTITQSVQPPKAEAVLTKNEIVGQPVEDALQHAEGKQIVAHVEPYEAAAGMENLLRLSRAPLRVPPGTEVTFYEQDGIVRYYALTEKAPRAVEEIRVEVEAQRETVAKAAALTTTVAELQGELTHKDQEMATLRGQLETVEAKQTELEAAPAALQSTVTQLQGQLTQKDQDLALLRNQLQTVEARQTELAAAPAALQSTVTELQDDLTQKDQELANLRGQLEAVEKKQTQLEAAPAALQSTVTALQGELARKDQELATLRSQLQAVEAKQTELEAAPELGKVREMEAELKELRTFRDEVRRFMKRVEG